MKPTRERVVSLAAPLLAWAAGMAMVFGPIIFSGMRSTFFGLGDIRLVNFTLEHSYRWATGGHPLHADFWSPPIFFPHENVAAFTDLLVGAAGPYWLLRAVDVDPVSAFLLWVFLNWSMNFLVAYAVFRRLFGIESIGASLGAFLFAFGNPRSADIFHQQLQPAYYLLLAFTAVVVLFRHQELSVNARRGWVAVFSGALLLQAYTAFYPLYFFFLCLLVAGLWAVVIPEYRGRLVGVLRRDWRLIGTGGVLSVAALAPMVSHYLRAADEVGLRGYPWDMLPRTVSWVLMGQRNAWYGWLQRRGGPYFDLRQTHHSHGVGPLTTVIAIIGLYWAWKNRSVRLLVLTIAALVVLTTLYPGGYSGWRLMYDYLPGAAALRAVARIGMLTLLPLSLGVAFVFGRLQTGRRWLLVFVLGAAVIAEQRHEVQFRGRARVDTYMASLVDQLSPDCEAFLLVQPGQRRYPHVHDDAAWISLATGIPTLNGRYGNFPPDYHLYDVHITDDAKYEAVRAAMVDWIEINDLPPERICWIRTRGLFR